VICETERRDRSHEVLSASSTSSDRVWESKTFEPQDLTEGRDKVFSWQPSLPTIIAADGIIIRAGVKAAWQGHPRKISVIYILVNQWGRVWPHLKLLPLRHSRRTTQGRRILIKNRSLAPGLGAAYLDPTYCGSMLGLSCLSFGLCSGPRVV
jgi:hypothetical protein